MATLFPDLDASNAPDPAAPVVTDALGRARLNLDLALKALVRPNMIPVSGSYGSGSGATGGECCLITSVIAVIDPDQPLGDLSSVDLAARLDLEQGYVDGLIDGWDDPRDDADDDELAEPESTYAGHLLGRRDGWRARALARQAGLTIRDGSDDDDDDDEFDDDDDDEFDDDDDDEFDDDDDDEFDDDDDDEFDDLDLDDEDDWDEDEWDDDDAQD